MSSVVLSGDTSGTVTVQVPAVAGSNTVTIPAVTGNVITSADSATVTPTMLSQPLTQATSQATTSGSTKDFTSIPSWVKRITVTLNAVSASTAVDFLVQLGTSGGIVSSGYASQAWNQGGGTVSSSTSGFLVSAATAAADTVSAIVTITNVSSNDWVYSAVHRRSAGGGNGAGNVSLGGTLTQIRLAMTAAGSFDAGSVNIMYE